VAGGNRDVEADLREQLGRRAKTYVKLIRSTQATVDAGS
jgi:hypothetical protein